VYFNDDSRGILFGSYDTDHCVNFEKHTGFRLRIYWNDGTPEFFTAPNVVSSDAWYFLTFIRDVSTNSFRIFVNGQLVETFSGVGSNIFPAGPFYIGRDSRTGTTVVNGKMDDVRIYYGALSDTEVLALYNETANVVDFTADVNAGITPLTVNFTDQSQVLAAPITEWLWSFGDGDSSSVQNPTHIYENSGNDVLTYSVSLGVKDANGSVSVKVKDNFIEVFPVNSLPGGNVSGVWTAASSPYFVSGEIVVPFGDTLIIEPGVTVKFKTNSIDYFNYQEELTPDNTDFGYMTVYGTLIAQGTEADSIVFTRAGDTGWWGMIHLTSVANPDNAFEFCKMDYSSYMFINPANGKQIAGLSFDGMDGILQNSKFCNNVIGILCDSSTVIVNNNYISANKYGISLHHSNSEISNNTILDNTQYGIRCEYDTTIISGNHISANKHGIGYNHSYSNSFGNEILNNQLGIYSLYSDTLTFTADSISSNGRGILNHYSTMQVDSCIISFNSSGIEDYQNNPYGVYNNTVITGCIIDSNSIGIKGNSTSISVSNTKISNNEYGISCDNSSLTAIGNTIVDNTGYGIYTTAAWILGEHIISENTISGNTEGGVLCMYFEKLTFENNEILDNGGLGVGIAKSWNPTSSTHVNNNVISENNGVGLYFQSAHNAYVNNNTISNNEATGLQINWGPNFHANNNIISDNLEFGVLMEGQGLEFINNTIVNNGWGGVKSEGNNSTVILSNSIIWGNIGAYGNIGGDGEHTVIYSCIENGYAGEGNIDSNPLLNDDCHLTWANFPDDDETKSPCIDTGNPGNWMTDPDDRDPDQSRMDMGAVYYHQVPAMWLLNPDGEHASYNFEGWEVGTQSDYEPFEVVNQTACFIEGKVFITKRDNPQFFMENLSDTLLDLQPFQSKTVGVAFIPTLTGLQQDTLNAGDTAMYHNALRIYGTGEGTGNVEGLVLTQTGEGVPGVTINVSGGDIPITKTGTTANNGYYYIANIGWGDFTITPEKYEDTIAHVFSPASLTGTTSNPTHTTILNTDFQDNSYFTVSGNISYLNTSCPSVGIPVLMDGVPAAPPVATDSLGNYTVENVLIGLHTLSPV
jgi:parallel beta-helix repeat protein